MTAWETFDASNAAMTMLLKITCSRDTDRERVWLVPGRLFHGDDVASNRHKLLFAGSIQVTYTDQWSKPRGCSPHFWVHNMWLQTSNDFHGLSKCVVPRSKHQVFLLCADTMRESMPAPWNERLAAVFFTSRSWWANRAKITPSSGSSGDNLARRHLYRRALEWVSLASSVSILHLNLLPPPFAIYAGALRLPGGR